MKKIIKTAFMFVIVVAAIVGLPLVAGVLASLWLAFTAPVFFGIVFVSAATLLLVKNIFVGILVVGLVAGLVLTRRINVDFIVSKKAEVSPAA